jgi:hypothetical protein
MPLIHGWHSDGNGWDTATSVESVCAIADADGGVAVFKGKGRAARRSMTRIAVSLEKSEGWNATVFGHLSRKTASPQSGLFAEHGTVLTVRRDGVDPSLVSFWRNG